jgi:hypothetical protein
MDAGGWVAVGAVAVAFLAMVVSLWQARHFLNFSPQP